MDGYFSSSFDFDVASASTIVCLSFYLIDYVTDISEPLTRSAKVVFSGCLKFVGSSCIVAIETPEFLLMSKGTLVPGSD